MRPTARLRDVPVFGTVLFATLSIASASCVSPEELGIDTKVGFIDNDGDGFVDARDNCPNDANPSQQDTDSDGIGTICDTDEKVSEEIVPVRTGTYFAEVKANGTGCPAGSWNTRIASDGLVFTTTFSAYQVELDRVSTTSVKDCELAIKLHSPDGVSYSVESFYFSGFALLDRGIVGSQQASYSFQGQVAPTKSTRTELTGPYDSEFVFQDDVSLGDAVWSPCGIERDLNVTTRLTLQTPDAGPSGYMNVTAVDGSARLVFRLATKSCADAGVAR